VRLPPVELSALQEIAQAEPSRWVRVNTLGGQGRWGARCRGRCEKGFCISYPFMQQGARAGVRMLGLTKDEWAAGKAQLREMHGRLLA